MGRIVSLNVSQTRVVEWNGKLVKTGIFKTPIQGKQIVKGVNISGDDQADRTVHGGKYKAIYGYPVEHYPFWKSKFPNLQFSYGMLGENLTTDGFLESDLYIGDRFHIGEVILTVVQPRIPCYKLGIKFGTQQMVKQFSIAEKPGYYFKIDKEGEIESGDQIELEPNTDPKITVIDTLHMLLNQVSIETIGLASKEPSLPPWIREQALKAVQSYS